MPRLTLALAFLAASSSGAIAAAYNAEANDAATLFLRGGDSSNVDSELFAKLQNDKVRVTALRPQFLEWVKQHTRVYETVEEEMKRMLVWIENHGEHSCSVLGRMVGFFLQWRHIKILINGGPGLQMRHRNFWVQEPEFLLG